MAWTIVSFTGRNEIAVVPSSWVIKKGLDHEYSCYWPCVKSEKILQLVKNLTPPETTWKIYHVSILGSADCYERALEKQRAGELTDHINTDKEETKRKRIIRRRLCSETESESDEEVRQRSKTKKKYGLPKPPPLPSVYKRPKHLAVIREKPQRVWKSPLQPSTSVRQTPAISSILSQTPTTSSILSGFSQVTGDVLDSLVVNPLPLNSTESVSSSDSDTVEVAFKEMPFGKSSSHDISTTTDFDPRQGKSCKEARKTYPMTPDRYQKRVIALLLEIRDLIKQKPQDVDTNEIERMKSLDEFMELQKSLENDETRKQLIAKCKRTGGVNAKEMVNNVMDRLMTNELKSLFSKKGRRKKKRFDNQILCGVVTESILQTFKDTTVKEIHHHIGVNLKHAPGRVKN